MLRTKDESLRALVAEVLRHVPEVELIVVDRWKTDRYSIVLARRSDPGRVAYISRLPEVERHMLKFKGQYFLLSCEVAPKYDLEPYHSIDADPYTDLDSLAAAIADHLGAA